MKVVVFDKEERAESLPYDLKDISRPVMFDLPTDPNNHKSLKFVLLRPDRYELRPVLEGVEVFLARDSNDEELLYFYYEKPTLGVNGIYHAKTYSYIRECENGLFCGIKPGQCVKAKIVLEEE